MTKEVKIRYLIDDDNLLGKKWNKLLFALQAKLK